MHFKITARTILQLGSELISSDAIAFYELIKNSFDARSPEVEVRIVIRIDPAIVSKIISQIEEELESDEELYELGEFIEYLVDNIEPDAPHAEKLNSQLENAEDFEALLQILKHANYIMFRDSGEGMSAQDLDDIYLTIGTRNRYEQRQSHDSRQRPILGEKGLGRLSVMRLGNRLMVETTKTKEKFYNILKIDWSVFSHDSNDLLDSVEIEPEQHKKKPDPLEEGTTIWIYDLTTNWTKKKLEDIAHDELTKFIDPFQKAHRDFIKLYYNKQRINLPGIDKILFENSHASVRAEFHFKNGLPELNGIVEYNRYNKQKMFSERESSINSFTESSTEILKALGPFTLELHWFNRQRITLKYGVSDYILVRELIDKWGGGVMVYRDGFRVNPYGGPDDDWLKLDKKALSSQGYKLNRRQFVGKIDISSHKNPSLIDQTNREGLRDSPEKNALIKVLQHIIWTKLKVFMEETDKLEEDKTAILSLETVEERVKSAESKVKSAINDLVTRYPKIKNETDLLESFDEVLAETKEMINIAKTSSKSLEKRLNTTIHLAGLGLMVDVIAHELNRLTHNALKTVGAIPTKDLNLKTEASMNTLKTQLKTLQTRLKVIDPLGPSGRQRKEKTNISNLIHDAIDSHHDQFQRHEIKATIIEESVDKKWEIEVVPGMIVQVLENLISNSVYWLKQEVLYRKLKGPEITIQIDSKNKSIFFSDNGPGIMREKAEEVFQPFVTAKPADEGKGLGLFISREIAEYHNAQLYLMKTRNEVLKTFVLQL